MSVYVIPTVPALYLGESLSREAPWLKVMYPQPHEKNEKFVLPGGECYCCLPLVRDLGGQQVEVVHTGYSKHMSVNDGLEYLRQIMSILTNPISENGRRLKRPEHLRLHLTSLPYAKQDSNWIRGEVNRAQQLVQEFLTYFDSLTVIAPHFTTRNWARRLLRDERVQYITPYDILRDAITSDYQKEFCFVSPGKFARTGFPTIRTHRTAGLDVVIDDEMPSYIYAGKNVGVVDDITLSGRTALDFATAFRRLGVSKLVLALPHIGTTDALDMLLESEYDRIYTTNSCDVFTPEHLTNSKLTVLDIAPLLIDSMKINN
ncbi:MAG: hypothetical protein J4428_00755 [Candidatus Aenigmarchaeota archaeon]|nr:hypothetical protein [Candidatus Aenigmarchaeota archaeon]